MRRFHAMADLAAVLALYILDAGHCFFFAACLAAASAMATMRWNNVHVRYSR